MEKDYWSQITQLKNLLIIFVFLYFALLQKSMTEENWSDHVQVGVACRCVGMSQCVAI